MAIFQNVLKEAFESSGNYESALNKAFSLFDKPTMVSMVGKEYVALSKPRLYKNSINTDVEDFTHSEMAFSLLDPYQINSTSIGGGYADWVSTTAPKDLNSQFKDMYDYLMNIDEINISRRLSDDDMDYLQEKIAKAKKEKRISTSSYSGEGYDKAINFLNNRQVTASNIINNTSVNTSTTKNASTPMDNLKKILSKTNPERRMWINRNFVFGENYTNNKDFSREVMEFYANTENTGKLFEKIAKFSDLEYTPEDFAIYENMFDAYKRATGQTTEEVQQQIVNQFRDWKVSPKESQKHFRLIKESAEEVGWQGSYDHLNYDSKLWTTNIDQAEQVENTIPRTNTDLPTKSAPFRNATKSYRPDIIMKGNNIEFDSIYNHTTVKKVTTNTTNTTNIANTAASSVPPDQPAGPKQGDAFWDKKNKNKNNTSTSTNSTDTSTKETVETTTQDPRYVNNTRIDLDPETSVSTMDISDPLNIHQKIVDGNGNTRDITWRRKGRWSDQKELVSDISWNENGVFDNIAQTYTGKDVSPIEWKYAADWSDDYIIGRAGDDEQLLNSMMNARERKIEARRKYEEKHNRQQQSSNTADNIAQQQVDGPKAFDPNDPTTWTDQDIVNMANGDPDVYEELLNQRNGATGGSTPNVETANETVNPPNTEPDMSNPLNWTDEYMDELSEGDPTYYEQLNRQRDAAIKAEKYKDIDPSTPSSWTDDYIKDTALNEDEFNWMNEKMRQAKNLDIVDNINQQRHTPQPKLNREQKRQQTKEGKQKGNQQKKLTKKEKEKIKKQQQFNARHKAMGNDPDDKRRINKEYNEAKRIEKEQAKQQKELEEQERQRRQAEAEQRQRIDSGDPSQWTDEDIKKMADGDPDVYENLINQRDKARGVDTSQRTSDYNKEMGDTDAPKVGDADIEKLEAEGLQGTDMDASMRRGTLGTVDKIMTGVNILGAIGDYKSYRRQGDNVISAGVKTAAKFAIDEALGLWAIPIALVKNVPGAIIKGADMLYKENRKMNSAAGQQIFGDAQFLDTQQLATMRQSGMEMAKMSQYNLQQTLMGNEATYLHR